MRRFTSMRQNARCEQRFRELIDADLAAEELERLARVDALLRVAAAHDREEAATLLPRARFRDRRGTNGSTWAGRDDETQELKLTFRQLALIHKSLQAVKTLSVLPPQDEVLGDTMHLVDLALAEAV
jgi:hypothetical protein